MSVLRAHQVYASLAPIELFPRVQGRLLTVAELLQQPQPLTVRRRLCVIAGHLAGLRAWLTFDLGDHQAALAAYDQALEPAEEAGDDALCGWILGGKSLIPAYAGDPKAALEMVGRGQSYAARSSNVTCQAWLDALEARAHAGMDDARDYRKAQDRANAVVNETQLAERRHGMDFDGNELSLSYYEGTSLATLRESRPRSPYSKRRSGCRAQVTSRHNRLCGSRSPPPTFSRARSRRHADWLARHSRFHPSSASVPSRSGSPTSVPSLRPGERQPQSRTSTSSSLSCG
jgi:hypothetical protein